MLIFSFGEFEKRVLRKGGEATITPLRIPCKFP